jgi:DNA polymerase I-like protein with 3'-5' exonuclease and polymerase domains
MSLIEQNETYLPKPNYKYITTEEEAREAMTFLDNYGIHAIDTETTALDPFEAKWSLLQIGVPDHPYVFDVRYDTEHSSLHPEVLNPLLQDSSKMRILQNASFDMKIIKKNLGYYLTNVYDTMLMEQLSALGLFLKADLGSLVLRYLGLVMPKEPRSTFKDYNQKFQDFQLEYAANDVVPLHFIRDLQFQKIQKESLEVAADIESRFLVPLCEMEMNGIHIDVDKWRKMMEEVDKERIQVKKIIQDILSEVEEQTTLFGVSLINIDSNVQLKKALNRYGLNLEKTDVAALSKHKGLPVIDAILDYRKANKLISTYAEPLLAKISEYTGRLHTDFKQMVRTGRMSSSNPNLQNIPKKQKFRSCFISPPGYSLLTADMSGAELRILGNLSKDPVFVEAYATGQDLHTRTAAEVFDVAYDKVEKHMRNAAKAINFGLCYGMSAVGLSKRLKISKKEAELMINKYFKRYKGVKRYLDRSGKEAVRNRYSLTVSGRRRYYSMPPYDHPDRKAIQSSIERQGMNAGIQGCLSADTIVTGIGRIDKAVGKEFFVPTGFTEKERAVGVYSGKKEIYNVKLSNGVVIGATLDHKIPVVGDADILDVPVSDLSDDHYIRIPLSVHDGVSTDLSGYKYEKGHWRETFVDYLCPDRMNKDLAFVIGCLIGDGSYTKHNHFRFCCPEYQKELFDKFNEKVFKIFNYSPVKRVIRKNRKTALYTSQVSSVVIRGFLKHIGLDLVTHREKKIPEYFYTETIKNKGALLNGLFSTDGGVTKKSGPNFTSTSKDLATAVQYLLFSLGINSNLKSYIEEGVVVHCLQVPKRFNEKFLKYVGFSVNKKQDFIEKSGSTTKFGDGSMVPPVIPMKIEKVFREKDLYDKLSVTEKAHLRRFKLGKASFNSIRKFIGLLPECPDKDVLNFYMKYDYCKVSEVSYRGIEDAYDIMCDEVHYFIANGVIVHNSNADTIKEAMCILVDRIKDYDAKLILTVHDEVVVEVKDEQKYEVAEVVSKSLVDGFGRYFDLIPMTTDTLIGPCWLKDSCENKIGGHTCGSTEMKFISHPKYGTKLVCAKCGEGQD